MIKFLYPTVHMAETVRQIRAEIGGSDPLSKVSGSKEKRKFLIAFSQLSNNEAAEKVYELKAPEIDWLIDCLKGNEYKVETRAVKAALLERKNSLIFRKIYIAWKYNYNSPDLKDIIGSYIIQEPEYVSGIDLTDDIWSAWNATGDIALGIMRYLNVNGQSFKSLSRFGITDTDIVYHVVRSRYILICDHSEYAKMTSDEIKMVLKGLTNDLLHVFLRNYLIPEQNETVLKKHSEVCLWFCEKWPIYTRSERKMTFWQQASDNEYDMFYKWFMLVRMKIVFNDDERSSFWAHYINVIDDVFINRKGPNNYQIAILFPKFVVVEFTTIGFAARILTRTLYRSRLQKYFEDGEEISNADLRTATNDCYDKINHSANWQATANAKIVAGLYDR